MLEQQIGRRIIFSRRFNFYLSKSQSRLTLMRLIYFKHIDFLRIFFDSTRFAENPQVKLTNLDIDGSDFGNLKKCFMEFLNKIVSLKNYSKFVAKEVSKAIILRTKLRN